MPDGLRRQCRAPRDARNAADDHRFLVSGRLGGRALCATFSTMVEWW
jgi:hypothetical protein